jgi:hypothetical protein
MHNPNSPARRVAAPLAAVVLIALPMNPGTKFPLTPTPLTTGEGNPQAHGRARFNGAMREAGRGNLSYGRAVGTKLAYR